MKHHVRIIVFFLPIIIFLLTVRVQAQTGRIFGQVVDENSGDALPGASVFLQGTSLGAAADIHGNYYITNIPAGNYTLIARYLGYDDDSTDIQLGSNKRMQIDIKMKFKVIQGEEVLVTAQAEGQMQAMNQQLSSTTIKNIVSKNQIQELPEANAAEAVGRLPGVSLERSGERVTKW